MIARRTRVGQALLLATCLPLWLSSSPRTARAQQTGALTAEALFNNGRAFLDRGQNEEACRAFAASQRLDPAAGTLFNLGTCNAALGRTASAWLAYREAAALAARRDDGKRRELAEKSAASIEAALSRLVVAVGANGALEKLLVLEDGVLLDPATFGVAIPCDPGLHVIEARALGRRPWSTRVEIVQPGSVTRVELPLLEPELPPPPGLVEPPDTAASAPIARSPAAQGSTRRTVGIAAGIVGLAGLGVGAGLGAVATSKWATVKSACPGSVCPDKATFTAESSTRADVTHLGNASTAALVAGGAVLASGLALYLTGPRGPAAVGLRIAPTPGGAALLGAF